MGKIRTVQADQMRMLVSAIYVKAGVPVSDADFFAGCLVDADLRGVMTHGCRHVAGYYRAIKEGRINPRPVIKALMESAGTIAYDGDGGPGHVVAAEVMRKTITRAKETGVAAATVRNGRHFGALAYYTQMAADEGCIGHAATNGGVFMAPFGGLDCAVGLNPVSWAVPTNRPWALNLDMSTSVVARGKIDLAATKGEKIPLDWALDSDGNPTDDPMAAQQGVMLPLGGAKGYGLALVMDVLCGVLSGGRYGDYQGVEACEHKKEQFGFFCTALSIEKFLPLGEFQDRMGQLIERLKAGTLAPNSPGIFLPGEIEYSTRQRCMAEGISYPVSVVDEIEAIRVELGIVQAL